MDTIKPQNPARAAGYQPQRADALQEDPSGASESEQILLLREIAQNTRKQTRRISVIMYFAIGAFAVFALTAALLLPRAISTLDSVDTMVRNTNAFVEENTEGLTDALSRLSDIDFSGLNDMVSDISEIDFDTLNDSIRDLHDIIDPIARLFGGGH